MQKAVAFAKLCLDNDIPTMGVCMGCQAIGKAIDNNSVQLQQEPTQWRAMLVDLINLNEPDLEGRWAILGFYNSWVVRLTSQLRRKVFATLNKFGDGIVSAVAKDGTFVMLQGHPDAFEAGWYQGAHLRRGWTLGGFEIQTDYLVYLAVQNKDTIDRGRDEDISIADYLKTNGSVKRKKSKRKSSWSRASKVAANGVVPKRYGRMAPIVSLPKKNPSTTTKSQIPGQLKLGLQ